MHIKVLFSAQFFNITLLDFQGHNGSFYGQHGSLCGQHGSLSEHPLRSDQLPKAKIRTKNVQNRDPKHGFLRGFAQFSYEFLLLENVLTFEDTKTASVDIL